MEQEPLLSPEDAITDIHAKVDFEDQFDYKPLEKSGFDGFQEKIFGLMRGKKKVVAKTETKESQPKKAYGYDGQTGKKLNIEIPPAQAPEGYEIQNGLLVRKKTLPEKVLFQIKNPFSAKMGVVTTALGLLAFAVGSFMIYSSLPTHPELVLGVIIVAAASGFITSGR